MPTAARINGSLIEERITLNITLYKGESMYNYWLWRRENRFNGYYVSFSDYLDYLRWRF